MFGVCVLINVDTGAEQAVLERVKSVPHVIDARTMYGASISFAWSKQRP